MYTQTNEERERLYAIMAEAVMPALGRAIAEASRDAVYEIEGFHPDISYGDNMAAAADEMAALLRGYFAALSPASEAGLYAQLNTSALRDWLASQVATE